jgi:hypothetical protein
VNIYDRITYNYSNYNQSNYSQPYYNSNYNNNYSYNYNSSLGVTCSPNTTFVPVGNSVTWTAYPTGGNGGYSYSWSGSDLLYGSGQSASFAYNSAGSKSASVTVYSNGQTYNAMCNSAVTVGVPTNTYAYNNNAYNNNNNQNNGTLDIGCYADPTSIVSNQPVTWVAEATGGVAPYQYSWTGSDGLTSSQSSAIKYYSSTGSKSAVVTVTSADGKSGSRACSNAVAVRSSSSNLATRATTQVTAKVVTTPTVAVASPSIAPQASTTATPSAQVTTNNAQSANSVFSLSNVPWGWVAVIIILVLFATVMYLLFNRTKI